jgi:hypothetical protein
VQAADKEEAKTQPVSLADGKLTMTAPADWAVKKPTVNFIEAEFATPAAEGDEIDGRLTIMQAGGGVEANIDRWLGQFTQPDGKSTKERAIIAKQEIAGQEVHTVDISGTFSDRRGPLAPAIERKDYRMLGAIVVTEDLGQYFVKYSGPRKTVAENEAAFGEMLKSIKVKN